MMDYADSADPLATLSERVNYLQGSWPILDEEIGAGASYTAAASQSRRMSWITGIGCLDKGSASKSDAQPRWEPDQAGRNDPRWLPSSTGVIVGMHGRAALAYAVLHLDGRLRIKAGVWASRPDAPDLDQRHEMLLALFRSCYVEVLAQPADDVFGDATVGGYVLGVPHPPAPAAADPATPWDRLLRGLRSERWAAIVLAQPVLESGRIQVRDQLLTESRVISNVQDRERPQHPLAGGYLESLKAQIDTLTLAGSVGAWRAAVYLLGDSSGYGRLSAAWRGLFSGSDARALPIRVHDAAAAVDLARSWALPDLAGPEPPGSFRFPFAAQTLLTSNQLAAYLHLPEQEHPGFSVEQVTTFDTAVRDDANGRSMILGKVLDRTHVTDEDYRIDPSSLTKHAFVTGVTGAGKTNTILAMLTAAAENGASFLVLEPAKTEYRSLLGVSQLSTDLRVFTAGDETVAPLRLNPLEVPDGTPLSTHFDLVRSLFSASFALWEPLPQLLERALYRSYADRGWDVTGNTNRRFDEQEANRGGAFPTLSDLSDHVEDVIRESGYDAEAMARVRGALGAAVGGLRAGGKGRMFDTSASLDTGALFDHPVVIEMEALGDEADKAFVMGLILIRLAEHRRAQREYNGLRHLLVVEEAHRLLSNRTSSRGDDVGDPGAKAIETFTNLLAEVRAYGQGLVIADQVPSRLAPEVLKNTNLKVVHRLVAEDDRDAVGATMVMASAETRALATLTPGKAAVFAEGEDSPVLVEITNLKSHLAPITTDGLRTAAAAWSAHDAAFVCCGQRDPSACERGRDGASSPAFRSLVSQIATTLATNPGAAPHLAADVNVELEASSPRTQNEPQRERSWRCMLWHGADYLSRRRGGQTGWTYSEMRDHKVALAAALNAISERADQVMAAAESYRDITARLYARPSDPFPGCSRICPDGSCLYRWPAADALTDPTLGDPLRAAVAVPIDDDVSDADAAAKNIAKWLTTVPKTDWEPTEVTPAWAAFEAAELCVLQLAVVQSRPDPSSSQLIHALIDAVTAGEADGDDG
jgi:DNA helicase HerA-like ATPase